MKTEKQIEKQIRALREELEKIRAPIQLKENERHVGKCFKYHNCYSGSRKWWMYVKVVDADDSGVTCFQFQDDLEGRLEITSKTWMGRMIDGYLPITEQEFYTAWLAFKSKIVAPL